MASSVDRTDRSASSSAQALGSRLSLSVDASGSRKHAASADPAAPYRFQPRNLGLAGEKPANMDVPRGHYLDIFV